MQLLGAAAEMLDGAKHEKLAGGDTEEMLSVAQTLCLPSMASLIDTAGNSSDQ